VLQSFAVKTNKKCIHDGSEQFQVLHFKEKKPEPVGIFGDASFPLNPETQRARNRKILNMDCKI